MLQAFAKAFAQLDDPRVLRVLGYSVLLSLGCFALLWLGMGVLLAVTNLVTFGWLEWVLDLLGWAVTLVVTWLFFPLVASAFVALFLERIAVAVELRHWPSLPKAPGLPLGEAVQSAVRFLLLLALVNVALLAVLVVLPPLWPLAWCVGNGFLLGREYFDLVALRRLGRERVRALRERHSGELLAMGCLAAFLATLPLVNFLVPVVLTAAMVHRFEAWRRAAA
ncbi:MAG: EI24 domain-containing protein [Planctomycetes bacterium]|nr:EI24 domain-containing protein [Planctomycetota bacterium]